MSVNRERFGAADEARKGFDPADWAVVAFLVRDIPPRISWVHIVQVYRLLVRHVPESGNYPHSEVRVWRKVEERLALITSRLNDDFPVDDPDRNEELGRPDALLDPDFHMRWRKHIALACKLTLTPRTVDGNGEGTLR
ncbi:MAG TPA: hypothetical protein VHR66_10695 [Gemmataceae bacterium]|nr:hypothetical protein [Gemmataceae bacterium]